jgi:hypothetical protein
VQVLQTLEQKILDVVCRAQTGENVLDVVLPTSEGSGEPSRSEEERHNMTRNRFRDEDEIKWGRFSMPDNGASRPPLEIPPAKSKDETVEKEPVSLTANFFPTSGSRRGILNLGLFLGRESPVNEAEGNPQGKAAILPKNADRNWYVLAIFDVVLIS